MIDEILTDEEINSAIDVCVENFRMSKGYTLDEFLAASTYAMQTIAESKINRINHAIAEGHIEIHGK